MNSIVILEDHPVMRKGLAAWFAGTGHWQVLGIAADLAEARDLFSEMAALPDILLLDIQLSPHDGKTEDAMGLDLIPWVRERFGKTPPVVVYTQFDDYAHANAALGFGVRGYVCKYRNEEELEAVLHAVLQGKVSIDKAVEPKLKNAAETQKLLTHREAEILRHLRDGQSNKRIASALGISPRTVENLLSRIYYKTGIASRSDLQKI
ncbi:LuxR C-terminal-related transcriptional regulator [Leadbettera azotonutricia]|uniref:Response regulator receiver n=1 Tax=Leadbettera azotonutricia (strain ATCC BAA-888 / DSM 13862 / ZAS-9) TaxID=545695 RepID=F5YCV1_LEAAZ|nr:response regulator transcription factor [Leadbettera azotonutricia]AEF80852.1 response regulator receiver [Leadbettera azotonutricia ZAS-9]